MTATAHLATTEPLQGNAAKLRYSLLCRYLYAGLSSLDVGDVVPPEVFLLDAKDGSVPNWTLIRKETTHDKPNLMVLVVEDVDTRTLWDNGFRLHIIAQPELIIRTQPFLVWDNCSYKYCCLVQQFRHQRPQQVAQLLCSGKLR